MRTPSRRIVLGGVVVVALALVLACAALAAVRDALGRPPERGRAAAIAHGELLAYEVWDGVPHVLFRGSPFADGRMVFDHLRLDWISIDWPPAPAWQLSGSWYAVGSTDAPASLHVARCTGVTGEACDKATELFGQINAPSIVALEVRVGAAWRRYPVAPPGFAVRLDGFRGTPTDYRWLDANGRVVWSVGQDLPHVAELGRGPSP